MLKPEIEKKAKEQQKRKPESVVMNSSHQPEAIIKYGNQEYREGKGKTRSLIADIARVSEDTVRKVETIEKEAPEEIKAKVGKPLRNIVGRDGDFKEIMPTS